MPKENYSKKILKKIRDSKEFNINFAKERRRLMVLAQMQDAMDKNNLTQTEVAKRMGVAQGDISKIINGKKPDFSSDILFRFFEAVEEPFTFDPSLL